MNSKERVLSALNHQEPDRVPLDLGGWVTTISVITYNKLLAHLGESRQVGFFDWLRQTVDPEETVLQRLGVDTRYVHIGKPRSWRFAPVERKDGSYVVDEWGCGFIKTPTTLYYNLIDSPLKNASISDLDAYPWPNPRDPGYLEGVVERARKLAEEGQYAVVGDFAWETWYERAWKLRGMENFYMDMALDRDFIHALLDKTLGLHLEFLDHVLSACGEYLDVIIQGGDLAGQQTTLMSPEDYVEFIKPRQKKAIDFIRGKTKAKTFWHCCGAVSSLIPHFIDVGIDILNPVQVRAAGMDAAGLKEKFGNDIVFWGGIDSQRVLPSGTPKEVEAEVRHVIRELAPGGGLVVCAVHNIQADVPPENAIAVYDTVKQWGSYPLNMTG
jgi:uroporphyrinogen decarboxylase